MRGEIGDELNYTTQGKYSDVTYSENLSITKTGIGVIILIGLGVPVPVPEIPNPYLIPVPAF